MLTIVYLYFVEILQMKNPGKLFEIIGGTYKGKYCIAYDKQQNNYYLKDKRLFVHYYDDEQFKVTTKYIYSKFEL